jgi:hypothetical protein
MTTSALRDIAVRSRGAAGVYTAAYIQERPAYTSRRIYGSGRYIRHGVTASYRRIFFIFIYFLSMYYTKARVFTVVPRGFYGTEGSAVEARSLRPRRGACGRGEELAVDARHLRWTRDTCDIHEALATEARSLQQKRDACNSREHTCDSSETLAIHASALAILARHLR